MHYYGTRLSGNISRRDPEGYLLCLNVPVARTGVQEYLPGELSLPPRASGPGLIPVFRPEEEVFAPETIASFEGMPVTNDHPPDGVDAENIRRLQAGHAHNVRRGAGEESDLLLADLIITDPQLIDAVLAGKREISCGYTYELHEENGRYIQRKIRGNHIAVVEAGRAGSRVSIRDALVSGSSNNFFSYERSRQTMKKSLAKILARMAKDGDTEAVAEFIGEMIAEAPEEETKEQETPGAENPALREAEAPADAEPAAPEEQENREITADSETLAAILGRLDQLIALLRPEAPAPAGDEDPAKEIAEAVEEALEAQQAAEPAGNVPGEAETPDSAPAEEIAELVESVLAPEISVTLEEPEDEDQPDPAQARDALRAALKAVRPALAKMTPAQRRKVSADIAANLHSGRRTGDTGVYAALARGARRPEKNPADLGRRIMSARNANYRGQ